VAKHRRRTTRAERRRLERQAANRAAREAGVVAAEERPRVVRSRHQLEALAAANAITNDQARAGARFYLDYIASGPVTHLRMPIYQPGPRPPKKHAGYVSDSLAREAARLRFERAGAVLDSLEWSVVVHVTLTDTAPDAWVRPIGYGRDPPLELLRRGLDALARHYGWEPRLSARAPRPRDAAASAAP
jgi:hypothetical protein